ESDGTDLSLSCADRHAELVPLALPPDVAAAPCHPGVSLEQRPASAPDPRLSPPQEVSSESLAYLSRGRGGPAGGRCPRRVARCRADHRSPGTETDSPYPLRDVCAASPARPAPVQRALGRRRRPLSES